MADELVGEQTVVPWEELLAHPTTRVTLRMPEATSEEFAEHARKNAEREMDDQTLDRGCWIQITEYAKDFLYRTALGD